MDDKRTNDYEAVCPRCNHGTSGCEQFRTLNPDEWRETHQDAPNYIPRLCPVSHRDTPPPPYTLSLKDAFAGHPARTTPLGKPTTYC